MAIKRVRPRSEFYDNIFRGTSLTIPVHIKDPNDEPIDLTGYEIAFTIKRVPFDFDMPDDRAYVKKDFAPQEPLDGKFYVQLSSADTDFEPGQFYFDIQIYDPLGGAVFRIVNLEFTLVGGPTNRTINDGVGQLPVGNEITLIVIEKGRPITVIAPIAATNGVTQNIADLTSEIEAIKEDLQALTEDIDDNVKVDIQTLRTDVDDLIARLGIAEGKITTLESTVNDHELRLTNAGW